MFKFIKRIMGLSGEYRRKLDRAYVLSFFESLASNVPICMLLYVLMTIMNGSFGKNTIIISHNSSFFLKNFILFSVYPIFLENRRIIIFLLHFRQLVCSVHFRIT